MGNRKPHPRPLSKEEGSPDIISWNQIGIRHHLIIRTPINIETVWTPSPLEKDGMRLSDISFLCAAF